MSLKVSFNYEDEEGEYPNKKFVVEFCDGVAWPVILEEVFHALQGMGYSFYYHPSEFKTMLDDWHWEKSRALYPQLNGFKREEEA